MLELNQSNPVDKVFVSKSRGQVAKLAKLVGELLDISRLDSGKLPLEYETFDFHRLLCEVIDHFQYVGSSHHFKVIEDRAEIPIEADRHRIEQVLTNLISNAIKYSPESSTIEIAVRVANNTLKIDITDHGVGLTEEELSFVFSKYFRSKNNAKRVPGLGLGLYIVKEIVDRHNGSISVQSKCSNGTTFSLVLPLKKK